MTTTKTVHNGVTFEQVLQLAQQLRPVDQARLVVRLAPKMEEFLDQVEGAAYARPSLRGILADLGGAPSADDIDEVQHEMWASFGQES